MTPPFAGFGLRGQGKIPLARGCPRQTPFQHQRVRPRPPGRRASPGQRTRGDLVAHGQEGHARCEPDRTAGRPSAGATEHRAASDLTPRPPCRPGPVANIVAPAGDRVAVPSRGAMGAATRSCPPAGMGGGDRCAKWSPGLRRTGAVVTMFVELRIDSGSSSCAYPGRRETRRGRPTGGQRARDFPDAGEPRRPWPSGPAARALRGISWRRVIPSLGHYRWPGPRGRRA